MASGASRQSYFCFSSFMTEWLRSDILSRLIEPMEHAVDNSKQANQASKPMSRGASPANAEPELHPALGLQQQAGNQAMQELLRAGVIQAKLAISHPDDPEEQEADAISDRIMHSHAGAGIAPTSCSCGSDEENMCDECRQRSQQTGSAPSIQRRANGGANRTVNEAGGREAPSIAHLPFRSPGRPLDLATRRLMEDHFGANFSKVRVHTGPEAAASARSIDARAYTLGQHIVFDSGRYAPDSSEGKRLLAHELVHTLQQDSTAPGPIQADFNSDFAGRSQTLISDTSVRPPGTIRVKNAAGEEVWAPFGVYTPQEIPQEYQDRIMESTKAFQWRNPPPTPLAVAAEIESQRGENVGELTVGDMRKLSEGAGRNMNIRIMMAHVDNDFRFVGYDMSAKLGSAVGEGFVESEVGTAGVGRALFADRVVRALQEGSPSMFLEVYTSQRTEDFHEQIARTAGLDKEMSQGTKYSLNSRQMVRIALAWSDALSDAQRVQLAPLASGLDEPTPAQVQGILQGAAPGSGAATSSGGFAAGNLDDMRRFGESVNRNVRRPLEVERLEQLRDPETAERILNEHAGFASVGGRLYRIQREGESTRTLEVTTSFIWQRVAQASAPPAETSGRPGERPVNLDPARAVQVGGQPLEGPGVPTISAGDVVIINSQQTFEARDAKTGRPLIGIFEGGEWYRILGPDGNNRTVEAVTREGARPIEVGGQVVLAEPYEPERTAEPGAAGGGVAGGVIAAGGIIMVANEILGPIGAALQNQRAAIRSGEAEIDFWTALGANPKYAMWDVFAQAPAPAGTKADTAVFGTWYFPYVEDIDADRLRAQLPLRVHTFYELQLLFYSAQNLGAFRQENNRWYAVVNRPARGAARVYDITDAIATIQGRTLDTADTALRSGFKARPASERSGRIFRIPTGTTLFRSQGGLFRSQPLVGAGDRLGPNALVREIRRTDYLISTDMVFVEPVNADAYKAVAFAQYSIAGNIEDVWKEVKKSDREVIPAELPAFGDGPLESFRAGPETTGDKRFGWENYTRDPEIPGSWTIARGEVDAFWVSSKAIQPVSDTTALPQ